MSRFRTLAPWVLLLLLVSGGAIGTRIDFVPWAPVKIVKADGTSIGYGYGAATDAARGTALLAAKAAAASGEKIIVSADCSLSGNLLKNGVNYDFSPGVTITETSTTIALFDDSAAGANGACTSTVSGKGTFTHSDADGFTFYITNASSSIKIAGAHLTHGDTAATNTANRAAAWILAGTNYLDFDVIDGSVTGVYWENGDTYVTARKILGTGANAAIYGLAGGQANDTPTGQFWVNCEHIKAKSPITAYGNAAFRVWITTQLLEFDAISPRGIALENGLLYITAQKIQFNSSTAPGVIGQINNSGGKLYLTADKISSRATSLPTIYSQGTSFINIREFDDSNGISTGGFVKCGSGSCYVNGTLAACSNAGNPFQCTGGSMFVDGLKISTQAGSKDLYQTGGTLTVGPDVVYDSSKTTGTITGSSLYGLGAPNATALAALVGTPTGSGTSLVLATSPTLVTPILGAATGTSVVLSGAATAGASSGIGWTGRSQIQSSADGLIGLYNNAASGFTRLNFGGTTSSFPAIKRASAQLQFRLADDSTYCDIVTGGLTANGAITATSFGSIVSTGDINCGATNYLFWNNRTAMSSPADGKLLVTNFAGTDFTSLQLGGTTSSFPAIKRSSATLAFRLADDSADASISANTVTATLFSGSGASLTALNGSNISSGTVAAARGGAGTSNGILKADGAGAVSAATAGTDYYKSGATTSAPQIVSCASGIGSPADATTYYFGGGEWISANQMVTTATRRRFYFPFACTITKAYISIVNDGGTTGTSETSTLSLRVNNTTDTTLSSAIVNDAGATALNNTSLSIAIAAGDYIEMKWVTPTWATNPTNVEISVQLEIRP